MNYEQFLEKYEPMTNEMIEGEAPFNKKMFETYGEELERVEHEALTKGNKYIATLLDVDGMLIIADGFHFVNRFGYFILSTPCTEDLNINLNDE